MNHGGRRAKRFLRLARRLKALLDGVVVVREVVLDRLVGRSNGCNGGSVVVVLALGVAAQFVVRMQLYRLPDLHLTMRRCESILGR